MADKKETRSVVITGSSKGIGLGLAKVFLAEGCFVALSSFEPEELKAIHKTLADEYGEDKVVQCKCDVTKIEEVETLWKTAKDAFGKVDIWINNAGVVNEFLDLWEVDFDVAQGETANPLGLGEFVEIGSHQRGSIEPSAGVAREAGGGASRRIIRRCGCGHVSLAESSVRVC